ncbi:hypothetical protein ACFFRR_006955 [Megaselia abdita]
MYCGHCEAKDQFNAELQLHKIKLNFEKDDSEFRMILQNKSYQELEEYMRTKYGRVRKAISQTNRHSIYKEGIHVKNDRKSDSLRKEGNSDFAKGEFIESLKYYYKSIVFAETDEKKALSYGNISAIFYKTDKLECCLTAIGHVKDLYKKNDDFLKKILKREEDCENLLKNKDKIVYPKSMPLSYPHNENNNEIVHCIEKGRNGGVFATKNMKFGNIIAVTNPIIIGEATKRSDYITCRNCWKTMTDTDIAVCDNCVIVIYCSEKCKIQNAEFHRLICYENDLINNEIMALELAFKIFSEEIDIGTEEFENSKVTPFDWDENNLKNQVKSILSMKTEPWTNSYTKFIMLNSYFLFLEKMKKVEAFTILLQKFENAEELFYKTYWKSLELIMVNSITSDSAWEEEVCTFFDSIMGHFNHSCVPNVLIYRDQKSDFAHYVLLEEVKPGEELFIAFGGIHAIMESRINRKKLLVTLYQLDCKCKECIKCEDEVFELSPNINCLRALKTIVTERSRKGVLTKKDIDRFILKVSKFPFLEKTLSLQVLYRLVFGFDTQLDI